MKNNDKSETFTRRYIRIISLLSTWIILFVIVSPLNAEAVNSIKSEDPIQTASLSDIHIIKNEDEQIVISAAVENTSFVVEGKLYAIYDSIDNNKVYFIENAPDLTLPVFILNIEFENNAKERNLNLENRALIGSDVIRVAAYFNETFYYAEQSFTITDVITDNVCPISKTSTEPQMENIISNATWYTHVNQQTLEYGSGDERSVMATSRALPSYGTSLETIDKDVIAKIGRTNFTKEQFKYDWTDTGGYLIESVEWPYGSGNILTSCLYYEVVRTVPNSTKTDASLEVELVVDCQYLWVAESNTLELHMLGTDFRMYDVKLAVACAQYTASNGYDYIWKQTTSLYNINSNNKLVEATVDIAKAIALHYDKYGILSVTDAFFGAFSDNDILSGTAICTWPDEYNNHYASISHGKKANKMLRGVRVDTDGHLLSKEREYLLLDVEVVDRDYESSSTNVSMTKAIKFAFSYNLRSKNPIWGWIGGGDDEGNITYNGYKTYTK